MFAWPFVDRYFATSDYRLTEHQLDSYNDFVDNKIAAVVAACNEGFVMKKERDPMSDIRNNLKFEVRFGAPSFGRPVATIDGNPLTPLYPNAARLIDADYSLVASAGVEITATNEDTGERVVTRYDDVKIAEVPIMLHSRYCYLAAAAAEGPERLRELGEDPLDRGGYFVYGGQEKVIVSQEDSAPNRPIVRVGPDRDLVPIPGLALPNVKLTFGSAPRGDLVRPVATHLSTHPAGAFGTAAHSLVCVKLQVAPIATEIDIAAVFRALGVESDLAIAECVLGKPLDVTGKSASRGDGAGKGTLDAGDARVLELLRGSLAVGHTLGAWTRVQALAHIAPMTPYGAREMRMGQRRAGADGIGSAAESSAVKRGSVQAVWILNNNLLPGEGATTEAYPKKSAALGRLVRRLLLTAAGVLPLTDRENFAEKRVRLAGPLLAGIFEEAYEDFKRESIKRLDKVFYNGPVRSTGNIGALVTSDKVDYVFDSSLVTGVFRSSFSGNWGGHRGHATRSRNAELETGIVLLSERNSYIGFTSRARKVDNPLDGSLKLVEPRHLHGTQYGAMCPVDSPDGADIGLAKNLAMLCRVTSDTDPAAVEAFLGGLGPRLYSPIADAAPGSSYRSVQGRALVLLNGVPVGFSDAPGELVRAARRARRGRRLRRLRRLRPSPGQRGGAGETSGEAAGEAAGETSGEAAGDAAGEAAGDAAGEAAGDTSGEAAGDTATELALDPMTSASFVPAEMEVRLSCDGGRCCRPLIRLPREWSERGLEGGAEAMRDACLALLREVPDWEGLFLTPHDDSAPMLEYLDPEELQSSAVVASDFNAVAAASRTPATSADPTSGAVRTHVELHPSAVFSAYTVTSPLMQHNQCTRNSFAAQQGKHAAGVYSLAYRHRMDAGSPVLNYGQRPVVTTRFERLVGADAHPNGENAVVAVMCYSGFNQEDAVIVNRAAVDRGLLTVTYYRTETLDDEVGSDVRVVVGVPRGAEPPPNIDRHGLPLRDTPVRDDDTLVGVVRMTRISQAGGAAGAASVDIAGGLAGGLGGGLGGGLAGSAAFTEEDASPRADEHWAGKVVDRAVTIDKGNMRRTTKIRYRKWRRPDPGDKLASRHGQKGVLGALLAAEDMPYTADGVVPDIIVNPHAFPSRMTLGQLLECLGAKAACLEGAKVDGTMFEPDRTDAHARTLARYGYHTGGEEVVHCGRTGRQMAASVFFGPVYYQRLKQVAEDKINYRGDGGPVTAINRQPSQGRANGGGQRLGEMEMDSIKSHGVAHFLQESSMGRSDASTLWTDSHGIAAAFNEREDRFFSLADPEDTIFEKRLVPRSLVTLVHELYGMGVGVQLNSHEG